MERAGSGVEAGLAGRHESLWIATTPDTGYPPLETDLSVDVAILGGGIAGVTTAFLLKKAGQSVALVEADRLVKGVTGHTTAKVTSLHRLIYKHLISRFGRMHAQQYADANQAAIEKIASIVRENNIACDFIRKPAYTFAESEGSILKIRDEVDAARSLGLPASLVEAVPLPVDSRAAVRFENQAQFHPRKYLLALAPLIPGEGGYIFEKTRAIEIKDGKPCQVTTDRGRKLTAREVVVATHYPIYDAPGFFFAKMHPSRSYVVGVRLKGSFPDGVFLAAEEWGHSFRSQPAGDGEIVLIGDGEHRTGEGGDTVLRYRKLEEYARKVYDVQSVEYRWSTQDQVSIDRVPYIGRLSESHEHVFVATGFGKWGMTNGTIAAMIISDLIQGRANPWTPVYNPSRFKPLTSAEELIGQNIAFAQHFFVERLSRRHEDLDQLAPGEGKLISHHNQMVAAYKDEEGKVYLLNPSCAHMKCLVHWNNGERSWDCPCHGSRFNFDGTVIQAPARKGLDKIKEEHTA